MRLTPALATAAPARAERNTAQPSAEQAGPRLGAMRRVVRGRRVQVEMLGANGVWSPLFCYLEPPAGGQEGRCVAPGCDDGPHGCSRPDARRAERDGSIAPVKPAHADSRSPGRDSAPGFGD